MTIVSLNQGIEGANTHVLLWMDEMPHHLRNPGMMIPCKYQQTMVAHGFQVVQAFVHPQYGSLLASFHRSDPLGDQTKKRVLRPEARAFFLGKEIEIL